jgi:hypothetical protein
VGEERERLRRGGLDHLPGGDPEPVAHERELVRERDVDGAEGVLVQLRRLRHHRARHGDDRVHDLAVEELCPLAAFVRDACDELRRGLDRVALVAGIDALGRVPEEEVASDLAARLAQDGEDDLLRRSRVRGRLEHDELPRAQVRGDGLGRGDDEGDVGRPRLRERRRHADRECVELPHRRVVRRRRELSLEPVVASEGTSTRYDRRARTSATRFSFRSIP